MTEKKELVILQLNDLHGYLTPHWEMIRDNGDWNFQRLGGLAKISTLFKSERANLADGVIALDNGDTFHGTYAAVESKGLAMTALTNELKFDAMTVHWEFAYGPQGVQAIQEKLDYPILAINCFQKENGELFFKPYKILERAGLRIAIIGLACPIVDKTMPPAFSEGVRFTIGNDELPRWIHHVKTTDAVDVIVVLSHLGFPQDVQLAKDVDGIDVIVSGHTHNRMDHAIVENGAIIFQSGCHGSFIGKLALSISDRKIISHVHSLIAVDENIQDDIEMAREIEKLHRSLPLDHATIVGQTSIALHRYSMLSSPMDDVLLEAIAKSAQTEIAFSNGWRYGAPIPPGPVTLNDLWNIIPTNPFIETVELTGLEIRQMLEENLEWTFAAHAYEQMGGYVKRIRGLKLYFKAENPKGHRIDRVYVEGALIDEAKRYKAAFVTSQGVPKKFGIRREKLPIRAVDSLRVYFESCGVVTPSPEVTVYEV